MAAHRRGPLGESPPAAGVVTALAGRNLHGTVLDRATEARMHRGLGELAAAFRHSARPRTPPPTAPLPRRSWSGKIALLDLDHTTTAEAASDSVKLDRWCLPAAPDRQQLLDAYWQQRGEPADQLFDQRLDASTAGSSPVVLAALARP